MSRPLFIAAAVAAALCVPTAAAAWPFPPGYEAAYKAYLAALPPAAKQFSWLTKMDGVASEPQPLTLAGKPVIRVFACKAHDCADNRTTVFLSADHKQAPAVIKIKGVQTLIGGAGPAEAACVAKFDATGGTATSCP